MIRVVLVGAAGRMGRAIEAAAAAAGDVDVAARVDVRADLSNQGGVWSAEVSPVLARGDVVVEFSGPRGARDAAARFVTTAGPGWYNMEDMLRAPGRAVR